MSLPSTILPESSLPPLEQARLLAELNLLYAQEELSRRIIDTTITTKSLLDMAEHSYKVSGMAVKNQPKEPTGSGVKIVFNMPATQTAPARVIEVSKSSHTVEDDVDSFGLPRPPEFLTRSEGNITLEVSEWQDA